MRNDQPGEGPHPGKARRLPGTRVRRVVPDDWATLRAVRLAALEDAAPAFGSTVERERGFGEAEWRRRLAWPWFLAWRAEEPVGLVAAMPITRPEDGDPYPTWGLFSMWVAPAFRGGGVADQLVGAVVRHARGEGAARIALWVADGNARARAFYRRLGFRPTGVSQTFQRQDGTEFDEDELALTLS